MADYSHLPEWTCHKVVRAARITSVDLAGRADGPQNTVQIGVAVGGDSIMLDIPHEVTKRSVPAVGDYLVIYSPGAPDEYVSWSPTKAFEDGYARK